MRNLLVALVIVFTALPVRAEIFKGFPDVVVCEFARGDFLAYLHGKLKKGSVVYMSLNGQSVHVDADGILHREGASCDGQTIEALRAQGRAYDLYERAAMSVQPKLVQERAEPSEDIKEDIIVKDIVENETIESEASAVPESAAPQTAEPEQSE